MGIETTVSDRKGKELSELPKVTSSNTNTSTNTNSNRNSLTNINTNSKSKKVKRRQRKMLSPIQQLFNICKEVFAQSEPGIVPRPEDVERIRAALDEIKPSDVGLNPDIPLLFKNLPAIGRARPIAYLPLHDCDKFSMGIFCLPPSGVIPLHNHPGMTVFSKLLYGTMHIKSYDWVVDVPCASTATANANANPSVDVANNTSRNVNLAVDVPVNTSRNENPPQKKHPGVRLAEVKVDTNFAAPCNTSILYPADGGNMHCFTAVTACAVLDVLGPPYSDPQGRHCTYYLEHPFANFSVEGVSMPEEEREGYSWLQETEKPQDLAVLRTAYRGPKIVEK